MRFGGFSLRFGCGFGVAAGSFGRGGIFFRRLFVTFAAVIGDVKAAAFEKQTGAHADFPFYLAVPPFFLRAKIFGTNFQRRRGNGLKGLKFAAAFPANIFVGRHEKFANKFFTRRASVRWRIGHGRGDLHRTVGADLHIQVKE